MTITTMDGVIDHEKKLEMKANDPKVLVLKWGNHKRRIILPNNQDSNVDLCLPPSSEAPLPEPKECPATMVDVDPPSALPWNLRTRNKTDAMDMEEKEKKMMRSSGSRMKKKKNEPLLKLAVSLSKSDIEEDFLKMIGKKPPSRPKKRSRAVQQDVVNTTYLGLNLAEILSDRYDVPEPPHCTRKPNE